MQNLNIKEQTARVMAFVRDQHPEWVTYRQVMYKFDIGRTKSMALCQMAAEISKVYEYNLGKIRYIGDPKDFDSGFDTLEEAFKDDEASEESVQYSQGEIRQIYNILRAVPSVLEDKGSLKMPRKSKRKWNPNDIPH